MRMVVVRRPLVYIMNGGREEREREREREREKEREREGHSRAAICRHRLRGRGHRCRFHLTTFAKALAHDEKYHPIINSA